MLKDDALQNKMEEPKKQKKDDDDEWMNEKNKQIKTKINKKIKLIKN